jgi:hypothetical protein
MGQWYPAQLLKVYRKAVIRIKINFAQEINNYISFL